MNPTLRVLYVEDDPSDADLARRVLARRAPHCVLTLVSTVQAALEKLMAAPDFDLVLSDLHLPDGSGLDLLAWIRDHALPLAVVILTGGGDRDAAVAALKAGAHAVLSPDAPPAQLEAALAAVARGLAVLPPAALASLAGRETVPVEAGLTRREREVLDLLAAGASNKVIARRLNLSFHTAKAHVASVLQKLGAGSRADAVARGARAGLVLL